MPTFGPNVVHMAHLHFTDYSTSDKEYFVVMETQSNNLFKVYGLYGRRNNATNVASKGDNLPYGYAWRIFQELKKSKEKKGYNQLGQTDNQLLVKKQELEREITSLHNTGVLPTEERDQLRNFLSILDPSNLALVEAMVNAKKSKSAA